MKHRKQESETEKQTRRRLANRESARRMRMRRVEAVIVLQQQVAALSQQNLRAVAGNVKLVEKLNAMAAALEMVKEENVTLQTHLRRLYQVAYGQDSFPASLMEPNPMMPSSLESSIASGMSNTMSFNDQLNSQMNGQHAPPQPSFPQSVSQPPEMMMSMSQPAETISQASGISSPDFRALFSSMSGLDNVMPSSLTDNSLSAQLNLDRTFGLDICGRSQACSPSTGDLLDFSPAALAAAAAAVVAASGAPHTSLPSY